MRKKAVFVGFDNVLINTISGKRFPIHSDDWELDVYIVEALKYFYNKRYLIIIITNQDSVRDGYVHEKVFLDKINRVCDKLDSTIDEGSGKCKTAFFYCIEDGNRRVPNNGMIIEALEDFEVSLKDSIMIGGNELNESFSKSCFIGKYIDCNDIPKLNFGI